MPIHGPFATDLLDLLPTGPDRGTPTVESASPEGQHSSLATVIVTTVSGRAALPGGGSCAVGLPFCSASTTHVSCTFSNPAPASAAFAASRSAIPDTASGPVCRAPLLV